LDVQVGLLGGGKLAVVGRYKQIGFPLYSPGDMERIHCPQNVGFEQVNGRTDNIRG
jgi:hypothetical protein